MVNTNTNDNANGITHASYFSTRPIYDTQDQLDYYINPDRQEHPLAIYHTLPPAETADYWHRAAEDAQAAWRRNGGPARGTRCREAMELIVTLPRCAHMRNYLWLAKAIAQLFLRSCGQHCCVAIHASHDTRNIHVHILFSLRRCVEVSRYMTVTTYLDANGDIVDRSTVYHDDGSLRPGCQVAHHSTPVTAYAFGICDPILSEYIHHQDFAYAVTEWINEVLQPPEKYVVRDAWMPYLPQQHIGKRASPALRQRIKECNDLVQCFNRLIDADIIDWDEAQDAKSEVLTAPARSEVLQRILLGLLLAGRITVDDVAGTILEGIPASKYADTYCTLAAATAASPLPDDPNKAALRCLYADRARYYGYANACGNDFGRNTFWAAANDCTNKINYYRRQLGIYYTADHARTMRELQGEVRYWRSEVLRLQPAHTHYRDIELQLASACYQCEARISAHPITRSARARNAEAAKDLALIDCLWDHIQWNEKAIVAHDAYYQAVHALRDTQAAYKAEQREYAIYAVTSAAHRIARAVMPQAAKSPSPTYTPTPTTPPVPILTTDPASQSPHTERPSLDAIIANAASRRSNGTTTHSRQHTTDRSL